MPVGTYQVKVKVNGYFVPYYQTSNAQVYITEYNTPKINSIQPRTALPGSFVQINGDFKTQCLTMSNTINSDNSSCAVQTSAIITRQIYLN